MSKRFSAQVDDIISTVDARMNALVKQSLQDVIDDAQTPVAKGGRMRVDTGFLRASGQASLNGMPSGPTRGERKEPDSYKYNDNSVIATIGKLKLGNIFFFGWTANYAKYRELYDGFLETALQKWPQIVAENVRKIKERIK